MGNQRRDALLVFTSNNLKIHNSKFRGALSSRAGLGYSGEIQGELKGWQVKTEAQKKAVVTSGGQLPYLAITHMPIEGYSGPEGLTEYKFEMITALEKGLDRANKLQYRRIVM